MFWNKGKNEIDKKIAELQSNLENNYKDSAHEAYDEACKMYEEKSQRGELNERQKAEIKSKLISYGERLKNYGHNQHIGW